MEQSESRAEPNRGVALMVASSGGHLTQLLELSSRIRPEREQIWVSFDGDHARSALEGRQVEFMPYLPPRGYRQLAAALPKAMAIMRRYRPDVVLSTGSGIALAFLPAARLVGASAHYIESATRSDGPSRTGRVLSRARWVNLYTQHPDWSDKRWLSRGSVFDGYEALETPPREVTRLVVSVGTMETYGFRRLVERLVEVLPSNVDVTWQVGATDVSGLGIDAHRMIASEDLHGAMAAADVVVGHAGTGMALTCFSLGVRPLLVPRSAAHGEHVDDHQRQTAAYLQRLGLAHVCEADTIDFDDLVSATGWRIERLGDPPNFDLIG